MGMSPDRIQAAIDILGWLEWIIRKISILALVLVAVSALINFGKAGLWLRATCALLGIVVINLFATALKRLVCSLKV